MRFRPRFSLRTLLVLVMGASFPMAWSAYQLNWIRHRHEFLQRETVEVDDSVLDDSSFPVKAPWALRLFGERRVKVLVVPSAMLDEACKLFPESLAAIRFSSAE